MNLCAVFDATVFKVVLPDEGHRTVPAEWGNLPLVIPQAVEEEGSDDMRAHWLRDDRQMLLDVLFGPGFQPDIEWLTSWREGREEQLIEELKTLFSKKGKNQ